MSYTIAATEDDLFDADSTWLDTMCREYIETVSHETGEDIRTVSARLGKAMFLIGAAYIGVPLQLDEKEGLSIAKRALRQFQDAYRRRKNAASN